MFRKDSKDHKSKKRRSLYSIYEESISTERSNDKAERYVSNKVTCRNKLKQRIVSKSGEFNVEKWNKAKPYYVLPDIVTTFIEARWRWTLMYCFLTYVSLWLTFAGIWWLILYIHGDLQEENLPHTINNTNWKPCLTEIYGFTSIFLFTIEVQTTVGYGIRSITLECPEAIFAMCMESIIGMIIQSFVIGIVFAKLTRPKNRAQTLLFSKNAIINQRDRNLCLIFRIGNTRKSRIISVCIRAYLIRCVTQTRGDTLSNEQAELTLKVDECNDVHFIFPISVVHTIDTQSPFYTMSARDVINSEIEILVVLEGTIESTGQPVQAKSSYTSHEILWGHRFVKMVDYPRDGKGFVIDYAKFDETKRVNTPLCAAKGLKTFYRGIRKR